MLVDATGVRFGGMRTYAESLLAAYADTFPGDSVVVIAPPALPLPDGIARVDAGRVSMATGRLDLYAGGGVARAIRRFRPDVHLALTPVLPLQGVQIPSVVVTHDLRHLDRPAEFSLGDRLKRRVFYGAGFRRADIVVAVSGATARSCVRHGVVAESRVRVVHHGADHVRNWGAGAPLAPPVVLAFAHHSNKGVELCVEAWRERSRADATDEVTLSIVGCAPDLRERLTESGLPRNVRLHPYLEEEDYHRLFASASCVVLPSTLEGFGLPVVEALFARKGVVVSSDEALLEVADGHAIEMSDMTPRALNEAVDTALTLGDREREAGAEYASAMTWRRTAQGVRSALVAAREGVIA